jgi:nanoRNase/pAp phosphatase (c-di-AMP/oligoRNAs hydrolase)
MAAAWTDELKASVIEKYEAAEPTPETSTEIIKDIAEDIEMSPNGVRMVLVQAGVYVKKDTSAGTAKTKTAATGDKPARVSKESAIAELRAAIEDANKPVDDDILSKLTGKAAVYFLSVLK